LSAGDIVLDHADVVVIGGGATGIGLLWDLTLRGLNVVLLEQAGLASGTSGAFHGLLHSGGRYAGTDPATARECLTENRLLSSLARPFIRETGGVFVRLEDEPEDWEKKWLSGCAESGIKAERVSRQELLARQPGLTQRVASAYRVPDAGVDGFGLLWSLAWSSAAAGARVYFRARVVGFLTDEAGVRGVHVTPLAGPEDAATRAAAVAPTRAEPGEITAPVVVNATGPWAADTAALLGPDVAAAVPVKRDKGVMIVFNSRQVTTVVNRLRPPTDGDIVVPHGPVTILGTTSAEVDGPGRPAPEPDEVELLMREGRVLLPAIDRAPPLRAYAGVRPLLKTPTGLRENTGERGAGRGFLLVDHGDISGVPGLVTVAGGKFTTFRAMAATAGDVVAGLLGRKTASRSASVGIPRLTQDPTSVLPAAARDPERDLSGTLICECELVGASTVESLLNSGLGLSDLRRLHRVGMGGCQGVFCAQRLGGTLWGVGWPGNRERPKADEKAITDECVSFREGRLGGVRPVEWGSQARLAALARALDRLSLAEPDGGESES
jgi:glycerol-3-phosphate dehydrogenase